LKQKLTDFIESKGQPEFFKDPNTSQNDEKNVFQFVDQNNKNHIMDKEFSLMYQNFDDPDKMYKRTFEMNLISNKLAMDNLKFKLKLNFHLKPIYWSNNFLYENLDNNFPDIYKSIYIKIKEESKKKNIEKIRECLSRNENLDKSIMFSTVNH